MNEVVYMNEVRRYGVFVWEAKGRYRRRDAIGKLYKSRKMCEKRCDHLNSGHLMIKNGEIVKTPEDKVTACDIFVCRTVWLPTRLMWMPVEDGEIACDCGDRDCRSVLVVESHGSKLCFENDSGYLNVCLPEWVRLCKREREVEEETADRWTTIGVGDVATECATMHADSGSDLLTAEGNNGDLYSISLPDDVGICRLMK